MDPEKRKALEAAGFRFGDAADFLGLTEEEARDVADDAAARAEVERTALRNEELDELIDYQESLRSTPGNLARRSADDIPPATADDPARLRAGMGGPTDASDIPEAEWPVRRIKRDAEGRLPKG